MTSTSIYSASIPVIQSKTEKFITKAKLVHGELYNYDSVEYLNAKSKVNIKCSIHGEFCQNPNNHLSEQGCTYCGKNQLSNTEYFINKAMIIHKSLYDYNEVDYINTNIKVKIICILHGVFEQTPHSHLQKHGCPNCIKDTPNERKSKRNAESTKRRATKINATPKWYETEQIKQLYIDCRLISEMTGIIHNVDHIVPLQSEIVCGLHCLSNLQIITATENLSKLNYYWPDMP